MILNPGTNFYDFGHTHGVIVSISLAQAPADLVDSLSINVAADNDQ